MKKRLNFTGRRKLASEHIEIRIEKPQGQRYASFAAKFDPAMTKGLDENARIYVEPYAVSSSMRFDFGTVAAPKTPVDTLLSELDREDSFLFRIKVVDKSGTVGRILADANGIRPKESNDDGIAKKSLFPVHWIDLDERVWRVEYDQSSGPVLQLSTKIPDLPTKIKHDPLIQGCIFPQALREVVRILIDPDASFDDDAEWVKNWREFVLNLMGTDISEDPFNDDQDRSNFVDDAMKTYANQYTFASLAKKKEEAQA